MKIRTTGAIGTARSGRSLRTGVIIVAALLSAACATLPADHNKGQRVSISLAEDKDACGNTETQASVGPPSDCARAPHASTDGQRIDRRKHWLTVGIVTGALYFMARAWFEKDPTRKMSTPGGGPPQDPCTGVSFSGRPPWCDPGAAYAH